MNEFERVVKSVEDATEEIRRMRTPGSYQPGDKVQFDACQYCKSGKIFVMNEQGEWVLNADLLVP